MKWIYTFLILSVIVTIPACNSLSDEEIRLENMMVITDYLSENNLLDQASVTSTGMYYIIDNPGNQDDRPSLNDLVTCNYKGFLPNGDVFDENDDSKFTLGNTIEGWRQGIPFIGAGGSIQLFIPSYLAYGRNGQGSIPGNQALFFEVDLIKVN